MISDDSALTAAFAAVGRENVQLRAQLQAIAAENEQLRAKLAETAPLTNGGIPDHAAEQLLRLASS